MVAAVCNMKKTKKPKTCSDPSHYKSRPKRTFDNFWEVWKGGRRYTGTEEPAMDEDLPDADTQLGLNDNMDPSEISLHHVLESVHTPESSARLKEHLALLIKLSVALGELGYVTRYSYNKL
jgi:hypothetical protein